MRVFLLRSSVEGADAGRRRSREGGDEEVAERMPRKSVAVERRTDGASQAAAP